MSKCKKSDVYKRVIFGAMFGAVGLLLWSALGFGSRAVKNSLTENSEDKPEDDSEDKE